MFTTVCNSHHAVMERQATALDPDGLRQKSVALYQQCIHKPLWQQPSKNFGGLQLWATWGYIVTEQKAHFGAVQDIPGLGGSDPTASRKV